jgi:hypothetical protein
MLLHKLLGLRAGLERIAEQAAATSAISTAMLSYQQPQFNVCAVLGTDMPGLLQLLWAFLVASQQVAAAAVRLQTEAGEALTVCGEPYPGEGAVLHPSQLQPLLDQAWMLLGAGVHGSPSSEQQHDECKQLVTAAEAAAWSVTHSRA